MTSVIHYRFKNTTEPFSTLTFDGQALPLATLKQLIAQHKHLYRQSAHDFELVVADAQTGDEYVRDDERIAKNTQVVVRRVPNTKAKTITTHIADDTEQSANNTHTVHRGGLGQKGHVAVLVAADIHLPLLSGCGRSTPAASSPATSLPAALPTSTVTLVAASTAPPQQSTAVNRAHRRPPPGYLCKRCGSPDHFVQHCPLYPTPPSSSNNTTRPTPPPSSTPSHPPPNATPSGPPSDLLCPLCHNLYHAPMVVPCCFTSFCDECVRQALLWEDSYCCPSCQHRPVRLEELRENDGLRKRVEEWMDSRGQREAGDGADTEQQRSEGGEAGGAGGSTAVSVAEDDVSVILAEPSAGQLAHQAKRDKQQNNNNTQRCFKCGEPGHRAAQCPNRHNQHQQPPIQPPVLPTMQPHMQPLMQQQPMHDPYVHNGYSGGGPMYNEMGMPMQPYGHMNMQPMAGGYGGMLPMGPPVPIYDDWGNFLGMQPQLMPPQHFYNQPPLPFMPPAAAGGGMAGPMGHMGSTGPLVADREAGGGMAGGWQHTQFMRHGDAMQHSPLNTALVNQPGSSHGAAEVQVETATAASSSTSTASATATPVSPPSAAPATAISSLLSVMPFVPPRSPPSSPPAATSSTTSASVAVPPAQSTSVSAPVAPTAPTASASSSPSPSASPPASASPSPQPVSQKAAAPLSTTPTPTLSVVSYSYSPSTWNNEPRPLLLCLLSNHLRTLYAPSALLGSAFRLTQLLTTTPLYRVTAECVPPKGSRSSLLLTREGMVEWKRREGEAGGVSMADDWKGRGGGWERVVEWMRGERQVRMVQVGEEWKEEAEKKEEERKVEEVVKVEESKGKARVSDVERRGGKRKVETDSQGNLQVKLHRRESHNADGEREQATERERLRDDSVESDDRRKRKRGGRREREKRERRHERQQSDNNGSTQQAEHKRREEGEKKGKGAEGKGGRVVVHRKQAVGDDDRYRPPAMADDENDVFAMVMQ